MAFGIVRISKLKTTNSVSSSAKHNFRERPTENANQTLTTRNTTEGAQTAEAVLDGVKKRLGTVATVRKNAVLAVEYFIGASPEWMQKASEKEREAFFQRSLKWLQTRHGAQNVVAFTVHRDELTPHACAYVVPIDQRGKLNAAGFFDGRLKMNKLQDDFAEAVAKPYGLQRGIQGSKAKHVTVKEFYAKIQQPTPKLEPEPELPKLPEPTRADMVKQLAGLETDHSRAVKQAMSAFDAKRKRNAEAREKRLAIEHAKATQFDLERAGKDAQASELAKLRETATNARSVPVMQVLEQRGYKPSAKDRHNFDTDVGRITVTGQKFFNHDQAKGGGGAIDLVMHLDHCDYKTAVAQLARSFGESAIVADIAATARQQVQAAVKEVPARQHLPDPHEDLWPQVRKYLVEIRKLGEGLVDSLHKSGRVFADKFANACFTLGFDFETGKYKGVEMRGTREGSTFHGVRGLKSTFLLRAAKDQDEGRVAVVESAIDALSLADLGFQGAIVSTTGSTSMERVGKGLEGSKVLAAFDDDKAGEGMAESLAKSHSSVQRLRPKGGKDWNEELRKVVATQGPEFELLDVDKRVQQSAHRANVVYKQRGGMSR